MNHSAPILLRLAFGVAQRQTLNHSATRFFGAAAELRKAGVVPDGHLNSDLSPTACHIGLGRRRDLTLRQDLRLWQNDKQLTLADVFKGQKVVLVGFPGGPVCVEQHIPGYIAQADKLGSMGVDKVICVTVDEPANVSKLAAKPELSSNSRVELLADRNGGLVRLLGLEIGTPESTGPKCQRYAAVVEDGVLLKLRVESTPADLKVTDAKSMIQLWKCIYPNACD
ncbi:hypothetical protein PLESTB_000110000 [Pleodorina starrii]|uniref:glutaredoxin-dependent peroxiredoxin n=1 Tax=Pleodorina starrii TaxID=330485 RepID=A0A9W6BAE2_9CHLO|nr:hypothetical protein PLESTM_000105500 [Pleodorina starrii]GLC48549.1 hypothetical protein PLESTB_000110000 [Pleodorina starrii]GLC71869.1 hypothetical protein PLESTF_001175800 [Pleodorina starrii]